MNKPRVAIFDFAGCEGCQLQILNLEEEVLDLLNLVSVVEWREGLSEHSDTYDIAIVEGSITRPADETRIRQIRDRAKILIALGACATQGGVNQLKNSMGAETAARMVYGDAANSLHLQSGRVKAVHEVVPVDYSIYGCPIDRREFSHVLRSLVMGKKPQIPEYSVCVECKRKGNVCRYEFGEICLGPLTRAGCDARCPSFGLWCYGCRGPVVDANDQAARDIMEQYGHTVEELEERMGLFGAKEARGGVEA